MTLENLSSGGGGGLTPTFTGVYLIFTIKHRLCTALKHRFHPSIYVLSKNKKSIIFHRKLSRGSLKHLKL